MKRASSDWGDASTSEGMARAVGKLSEAQKRQGRILLCVLEEAWLCFSYLCAHTFDFRLLASRTMRQRTSLVLNHTICEHLLWKP